MALPGKFDINPATGKQYGINPSSGVQDDNYWANTVEPGLKSMYGAPSGGGSQSSMGSVNDYLKDYTKNVLGGLGPNVVDENGVVDFAAIKSSLAPTSDLPAPINRAQMYADLRQETGVGGLEETLTNLKAAQMEVYGQLNVNKNAERGKTVAQNVIEGRIGKETQVAQEQADFYARQISTVTDQLNTSYSVINTYMNFAGMDYQDAVARYDREFTQNLNVLELVQSTRQAGISEYGTLKGLELEQAQFDYKQKQDAENNARANLQIMMNAITSGNVDPGALSSDQKLQIAKLETQSGLPVGFTSNLGLSFKDSIIFQSTDNGVTQIGVRAADGTITVKTFGTKQGTATDKAKSAISDMSKTLSTAGGSDGIVSPSQWNQARQVWISAGLNSKDFDQEFAAQHINTDVNYIAGYSLDPSIKNTILGKQLQY